MIALDGAMGTELEARGFALTTPAWSARAIDEAPELVAAIHRDYARAGARVHAACTFRTTRRSVGAEWQRLAARAIAIAKGALPEGASLAASIAPVEDCYRPDLSPAENEARARHRETARAFASEGVDLLLCETFANADEARVAVEEAVATGVATWVALTAGPAATLMTTLALVDAARACVDAGACAVLVNCVAASLTLPYVEALAAAFDGRVPIGAYANAGTREEGLGWSARDAMAGDRYAEHARLWIASGATIVGGCCGTGPAHVAAIARLTPSASR